MSFVRPEIAAMRGYVPGEQPQGGKFIKLNTNENPYPCSTAVNRAIEAALRNGLAKYPDPLATAFRRRAAEVLGVGPEWILCGNGSDDLLTILTRTFVGAGERLRLPYPSYILYRTLAQLQGANWEEVMFAPDWSLGDEFAATPTEARQERRGSEFPGGTLGTRQDLKLAFLPNPNSPSGTMLSVERVRELAEKLPCPLVVDEAYADFADFNCLSLVRENEKVLVTRTLSKSYSLAGLRFGFVVAQPHVIAELEKVKDSYNCDTLSIAGATAAIDDQTWLTDNRGKIVATRKRLTDGLRGLGFNAVESQANFVWAPHLGRPVRPLYEGLKSRQILVRYMDYPNWGEGLRISVGSDDQIHACLATLEELLKP